MICGAGAWGAPVTDGGVVVVVVGGIRKVLLLLVEKFFETESRDRFLDTSGPEWPWPGGGWDG